MERTPGLGLALATCTELGHVRASGIAAALLVALGATPVLGFNVASDSNAHVARWKDRVTFRADAALSKVLHEPQAFSAVDAAVSTLAQGAPLLTMAWESGESEVGFMVGASEN